LNVFPDLKELASIFHIHKHEEVEEGGRLHLCFLCKRTLPRTWGSDELSKKGDGGCEEKRRVPRSFCVAAPTKLQKPCSIFKGGEAEVGFEAA